MPLRRHLRRFTPPTRKRQRPRQRANHRSLAPPPLAICRQPVTERPSFFSTLAIALGSTVYKGESPFVDTRYRGLGCLPRLHSKQHETENEILHPRRHKTVHRFLRRGQIVSENKYIEKRTQSQIRTLTPHSNCFRNPANCSFKLSRSLRSSATSASKFAIRSVRIGCTTSASFSEIAGAPESR